MNSLNVYLWLWAPAHALVHHHPKTLTLFFLRLVDGDGVAPSARLGGVSRAGRGTIYLGPAHLVLRLLLPAPALAAGLDARVGEPELGAVEDAALRGVVVDGGPDLGREDAWAVHLVASQIRICGHQTHATVSTGIFAFHVKAFVLDLLTRCDCHTSLASVPLSLMQVPKPLSQREVCLS